MEIVSEVCEMIISAFGGLWCLVLLNIFQLGEEGGVGDYAVVAFEKILAVTAALEND